MSTEYNESMVALLKRQEAERQDLAAGVYIEWQAVKEIEKQLLTPYDGSYDHAPQEIKDLVQKNREAFWKEWGSEGRLATLMSERQVMDREKRAAVLAKKQIIMDRIHQNQQRQKGKDQQKEP